MKNKTFEEKVRDNIISSLYTAVSIPATFSDEQINESIEKILQVSIKKVLEARAEELREIKQSIINRSKFLLEHDDYPDLDSRKWAFEFIIDRLNEIIDKKIGGEK